LAQVILFVSYFLLIVPLTVGLASAAIAMSQPEVRIVETPETTSIDIPTDILFDFDKTDLRPGAAVRLEAVAEVFRQRGVSAARIEGHTDSVGDPEYTNKLSLKRAEAGQNWLKGRKGLSTVNLSAEGFGDARPAARNKKPDDA
jgi:outer membrane protein OmpA-like peptidoglycan-associated protein